MNKFFIIDGHALIFRMFYAFFRRPMVNSKGEDTSILFGFTKYLLEVLSKEHPTHVAICFDAHAKTFRHEAYPEYKANRTAAPQLVIDSVEPLTEIAQALGIPVIMKEGFEADDVICSLATRFAGEQTDVYMVTPDKDFGQAIDDHIFQYKPGKGGAENEVVDKAAICAQYGISSPLQVIDILTLWGDASDNVPGVKGVGEKGAQKLVSEWGSVENIYAHLDTLPAKMQQNFRESEGHIALSKYLITIKKDVPLEYSEDDFINKACYNAAIAQLLTRHEMNSLRRLLPDSPEPLPETTPAVAANTIELSEVDFREIMRLAGGRSEIAVAGGKELVFASMTKFCRCSTDNPDALALLADASVAKVGYNLKALMRQLMKQGAVLAGKLYDIEIMHYLINPERSHKLDMLARGYLDLSLEKPAEAEAAVQGDLFAAPAETEDHEDRLAVARETAACSMLKEKLADELKAQGLMSLYTDIEMPLIEVLASMEHEGVKVDTAALVEYGRELNTQMLKVEEEARQLAGEPELNLSSPRQIGVVLYEKLQLDSRAKKNSRDNYPTDEETLQALAWKHPLIGKILEFRGLKKLISTYIEPFQQLVDPVDGKIHTTFTQALTATGRLSSLKPNLQNIPVRTAQGQQIRKAFVPSHPGGYIVSADYSQIELRIMAHLSGDEGMIEDFRSGHDIHAATAAKIYKVPVEEVTREQRSHAKTANFGIIYGISAFGLSQRLSISRAESKALIDQYFQNYPGVRAYIDRSVEQCRKNGYVETVFHRKRFLPDINSRNFNMRQFAERNAVNAPIQGSAADIIKLAMAAVYRKMKEEGLQSRMVLQVHDELVFDVVPQELDRVMEIAREQMENVCKLRVALTAECGYGTNWLEAH
ncbi:MAG: DNA polymerase I [Bacteroidales bacterium]|nr:DNA polymerase I [Bacteroidales bacterium]